MDDSNNNIELHKTDQNQNQNIIFTYYLSLPIEQNYGNHLIQEWDKNKTPKENTQLLILEKKNSNKINCNSDQILKSSSLKFFDKKKKNDNVITILPPINIKKKYDDDDDDNELEKKNYKCLRMEDYGKAIYRRNFKKINFVEIEYNSSIEKNDNKEFDLIVSVADGHGSVKFDNSCYLGGYELAKFAVENILFILENSNLYLNNTMLSCKNIVDILEKTYNTVGRLIANSIQSVEPQEDKNVFEKFWWNNLEQFKNNQKFFDYSISKKVKIDNQQLPMLFYTNEKNEILACAEYGCTSTTLLFKTIKNKMYVFVANIGDSDAYLFHYNKITKCYDDVIKLTITHDGKNLEERNRVLNAVPPNLPVNLLKYLKPKISYDKKKNKFYAKQKWPNNKKREFELMLTRSFGHESFWKYFGVLNKPDINYFELNDQDVVVVATDGLWGHQFEFTEQVLNQILCSLNKCLTVEDNADKTNSNAFINWEKNIVNYVIDKRTYAKLSIDNILLETVLIKSKTKFY